MMGMTQLLETIYGIRESTNFSLKIEGILITKTRQYTRYERDVAENLRLAYGDDIKVFKTMIPYSVRAQEIVEFGCSVYKSAPKSAVATAYRESVKEFLA